MKPFQRQLAQVVGPSDLDESMKAALTSRLRASEPQNIERAVRQIETFAALPTQELDDLIAAREADLARLKALGQKVRDAYVQCADDLKAELERAQAVNSFTEEAFRSLADKCAPKENTP